MFELFSTTRNNHLDEPVISAREGALGADASFPGILVIHIVNQKSRPRQRELIAALQALRERYPDRRPLLSGWDALHCDGR